MSRSILDITFKNELPKKDGNKSKEDFINKYPEGNTL